MFSTLAIAIIFKLFLFFSLTSNPENIDILVGYFQALMLSYRTLK